jgi:proteasome lid subunit RPN8/RPN11
MNLKIKSAIRNHALGMMPNEACGFIYTNNNTIHVLPCKNISPEPTEAFEIAEEDYIRCTHLGEVVGIYHSHSEGTAFSEEDIERAEEWALPYFLYAIKEGEFRVYYPKEYTPSYLGRPFIWGHNDCYTIVREYYRRELNIALGDYDCDESFENSERQDILIGLEKEGFIMSTDFTNIEIGDVLLFQFSKVYPQHVGIYMGGNRFLHQPLKGQSRIEQIDGIWAQNLKAVLRHKSRLQNRPSFV